MDCEIINLQKKTIIGITERTKNSDKNMGQLIGDLWGNFYSKGIYQSIKNKTNDCTIGLYSDYETDENGEYSITVGCEVNNTENILEGTVVKYIPQGKYAKFVVEGDMQTAVAEFWAKLWEMPLDRTFTGDFEEYQPKNSMEYAVIYIYIAIK